MMEHCFTKKDKNGATLTPIYPKDIAKQDKLIIEKLKKQTIYNDQTIELNTQ